MIKIETLFKNESLNETLKKTYQVNHEEVYISFKKGMVRSDEYYMVERVGKNIRLTPSHPYLIRSHPEDPRHRKVRTYTGRSPCISLPQDFAKPDQLFRVIKSTSTGIIWLLRIDSFSYADETSIPPEVLKVE
ncbi:MAG TPA: hypothetical protein VJ044_18435 [Candidatus Hodarchaeales archaeon]|nr:hypothetical protein [Candidatus Hodarchaeales archaeon]